MEEGSKVQHNSTSTVALAISGRRNSYHVIQWALSKFISEDRVMFKLLYVQPTIRMVPTPMGNYLPIDQVRDDVAAAYRKEEEWKIQVMLGPYKKIFTGKKIETEVVVLEADDVAEAIAREVTKNTISRLVIGASSANRLIRKLKGDRLSSRIAELAPPFCTVFVISKGKLSSVRQLVSETDDTREENDSFVVPSSVPSNSSSLQSEVIVPNAQVNFPSQPSLIQLPQNLSSTSKDHEALGSVETPLSRDMSPFEDTGISTTNISDYKSIVSLRSFQTDKSWNFDMSSRSCNSRETSPSKNEGDIDLELQRLRTEINHFTGMLKFTRNEPNASSQQSEDTRKTCFDDMIKLQELWLEKASKIAEQDKERCSSSHKEAEHIYESTKREVSPRKNVDSSVAAEALENRSLEETALACGYVPYTIYTWEDIATATLSFSETRKIGAGANGTVYKGRFRHTTAAVKVLHSDEGYGKRQFTQELEVLSRVRHPHLLLLLGACPDKGCLVYEYMENGSLEDRLRCRNNTPPLPWFCRFRIAWEVASALAFLHSSKPEPIIHRDLKPANILLDHNLVSKIGDAGLSTLLPTLNLDVPSSVIFCKDTAPVGTFFYIDPEYQRTGLVSVKSDTYALGMVILQLLTAQSPMGLALTVEAALEKDRLADILDSKAGRWPETRAKELAILGMSCVELRSKDRPDLEEQVLPALERLRDVAEQALNSTQCSVSVAPSHFICPLLKVAMEDPCIASDGYTYDRKAIERWFEANDKSPMTNLPLPSKDLLPNTALLSAIRGWKSTTQ